jgi:hypothetical protein
LETWQGVDGTATQRQRQVRILTSTFATRFDLLNDSVTVPLARRETHENVKLDGRKARF